MPVKITIRIPLYPTEKRDRVLKCVENLIGGSIKEFEEEDYGEYKILLVSEVPLTILQRIFREIKRG